MKTRLGFVSNSSSASFIVKKAFLDDDRQRIIDNYAEEALKSDLDWPEDASGWSMHDGGDHYEFYTTMDNFSLDEFFARHGIAVENYQSY